MNETNPRLRLGFAGTPEFAVPALERLAALHDVCAVFTQPDRPAGRGRTLQAGPVKVRALQLNASVHQPDTFKAPHIAELLRTLRLDALVVAAYGLILPATVLSIPRLGCLNIHASLLPRWRGAAPIQRAMLAGDEQTGVTIMRMEQGLDTGPMLAKRTCVIDALDTAKTLQDKLAQIGSDLMADTLRGLQAGSGREEPQPLSGITYAAKITKAEARIDWTDAASQIWRKVRAFNPWPVAETHFHGMQLRVWDAVYTDAVYTDPVYTDAVRGVDPGLVLGCGAEGIDVACGEGVLRIKRLQLAGRKSVTAAEFSSSQRLAGTRFAS